MKEPEEYLRNVNSLTLRKDLYKIGKQMQIDAYNEGIQDAADNVRLKEMDCPFKGGWEEDDDVPMVVDKESILKLKK